VSPDDVHTDEMPTLYDDQWPADDPALAALAEDLRIVASGPAPEPRPGLVAVMAQGTVRPSGPQPGRKKMLVKTALGSLAAKVALGVGVAAASMTAVGATGVLPDAAQHAVASVVSATTPFALPDPSTAVAAEVGDDTPGSTTTSSSTTSSTTPTTSSTTPTTLLGGGTGTPTTLPGDTDDGDGAGNQADNHGACVSAVAQDKTGTDNHGKTVSSVARSDCGKTSTSSPSPSSTSTSTSTSTPTTVAGASRTANSGPGNNGNNGNGNGNSGGGSGKSSKG
jgi:hypothetical protein